MRVSIFLALCETIPSLERAAMIGQVYVLTLAGQRGVSDQDFKEIMRRLETADERVIPLPPEELEKFKNSVEKINNLWAEIGALTGE